MENPTLIDRIYSQLAALPLVDGESVTIRTVTHHFSQTLKGIYHRTKEFQITTLEGKQEGLQPLIDSLNHGRDYLCIHFLLCPCKGSDQKYPYSPVTGAWFYDANGILVTTHQYTFARKASKTQVSVA